LPVQLIDVDFYIVFTAYGSVTPPKPFICLLWWIADYGFYLGAILLMTWLAIERHILIFHDGWISTRRKRFLAHYLPLIIILTYFIVFYSTAFFFIPCENTYDYSVPVCGFAPCYQEYGILGRWEYIVNATGPILLENIFSIGLVVRVLLHQRRLRQSAQWRKNRRMMLQLFLVSGLNASVNLPIQLIPLAHLWGLPEQDGIQTQLYFYFLGYWAIFLFPFASLCQYPELRKTIKNTILCVILKRPRQTAAVGPAVRGIVRDRPA